MINASYPYANVRDGTYRAETGAIWPIGSNSYTIIPPYLDVEWPSVESMAETFAILNSAAQCAGLPLQMRKWDNKKWFRQLALLPAERCKNVVRMRDGFHADKRVEMGRAIAAHAGMRVTALLCDIIERRVAVEDWVGLRRPDSALTPQARASLLGWQNQRRAHYPNHPRQSRLVLATPFQDDIMVVTVGSEAAERITQGVEEVMAEFGIPLSDKPHCNVPFDEHFNALGATFDSRGQMPTYKPMLFKIERFEKMVEEFDEIASGARALVPLKRLQEVAGHMEYLVKFVEDGILRAQEAYVCMSVGKNRVHRFRPVTKRLVTEMQKLLRDLRRIDAGMPWVSYPYVFHAGAHGFTTDACALGRDANTPGGWGICVFGVCAYGRPRSLPSASKSRNSKRVCAWSGVRTMTLLGAYKTPVEPARGRCWKRFEWWRASSGLTRSRSSPNTSPATTTSSRTR